MSFEIVENICVLEPDVGRLMNKLYVFKAENLKKLEILKKHKNYEN